MIEIDHVIILVPDLDRGSEELLDRYGLASVAGGRHSGHGTANRIVPLGTNYLELMAVFDPAEAAGSPLGRWVSANAKPDLSPAALCLRTDAIAPIAAIVGEEPGPMNRHLPDGTVLSWHLAGLDGTLGSERLPFFIEWDCAPKDHPGATAIDHHTRVEGISAVAIGPPGPFESVLGEVAGLTIEPGSGVLEVAVATRDETITLR